VLQRCPEGDLDAGRRQGGLAVGRSLLRRGPDALLRIVVAPPGLSDGLGDDLVDDPAADWRGLSPEGHDRAARLARALAGLEVDRVLVSPALRCRQTVVPLAMERGLDVEPTSVLSPGHDIARLARLVTDPMVPDAVLCVDEPTLDRLVAHLRGAVALSSRLMSAWTPVGWVLTLVPTDEDRLLWVGPRPGPG
jgi:phosphohistidine phosphatase SixA